MSGISKPEDVRPTCKVTFYYATGRIESPGIFGTREELSANYHSLMNRRFKPKSLMVEGETNTTIIDLNKIINITVEESDE